MRTIEKRVGADGMPREDQSTRGKEEMQLNALLILYWNDKDRDAASISLHMKVKKKKNTGIVIPDWHVYHIKKGRLTLFNGQA